MIIEGKRSRFTGKTYSTGWETVNMAGPTKKEVSQAAKDLANPKTPARQKSEAAETLNYKKASSPPPKTSPKRGK